MYNNESLARFEAEVDGRSAFLTYKLRGNTLALLHTEVPPELEGHGVGSGLARFALEFARERNLKVLSYCPFVTAYIRHHPEYASLLRSTSRGAG